MRFPPKYDISGGRKTVPNGNNVSLQLLAKRLYC